MFHRTRRGFLILGLTASFAFALAAPALAARYIPHEVWVIMGFPATWSPAPQYELQVGDTAFHVGAPRTDGTARVRTNDSVLVTLRRLPGCHLVTQFTARSGYEYSIDLTGPMHAKVNSAFGADSPSFDRESKAQCELPATETTLAATPVTPTPFGWATASLTGLIALAAVFALRRRLRFHG